MEAATVMIVDDNPSVRDIVRVMLTKAGYLVVEAGDGETAIARLKNSDSRQAEEIATIICDLQMPKINGAEVIAHLRIHHPTIPFVILTADPDFLLNEVLAKQGVCDYLIKPVSKEKLLNAVRLGVQLHRLREKQSRSER
jgi:CheY-like chemotaxis protein